MRQSQRDWYESVTALRAELEADPGNLEVTNRVWALLSGSTGFDVRSGRRAVDVFRSVALKSDEGLAAMFSAFRELFIDFGECPRAVLFDPPLENLLRMQLRQTNLPLRDDIEWIVEFIECGG